VKCLGVHIDNNLDWSVHAKKVIKSFRTKLIKLFSMRFLHPPELSEIYFKGILPSVLYSIAIWGSCSNSIISTLNGLNIKAARFINRIKKTVPNENVLDHSRWKSITWYYKRQIACIVHQIYHNNFHPLNHLLTKRNTGRSLRNNHQFNIPPYKTIQYKKSFTYRAAVIWNNL